MLLPPLAELALGEVMFTQLRAEHKMSGTLLPGRHPDCRLVRGVAERIVKAAATGRGGGFQRHVRRCGAQVLRL